MTIRNSLFSTLLMLASFTAVQGQAQSQYDKGTPPQLAAGISSLGSYVSTELGTVNLSNGGLNFNIPLGAIGGRGNVALPLTLSYSSKVWSASMDVDIERESGTEQSVAYADYDNQSSFGGAAAPGWTLRTGMYLSTNFVRIKRIMSGPSVGCYTYGLHKLTLNLPDKGEIEFRDDATDGAPLLLNCSTQQTASRGTRWHATDGSGAIFINDVDNGVGLFPTANLSGTIIFADGTRFGTTTNGAIVDRNGNKVTFTANGYLDQLGRNTTIQYGVTDPDSPSVTLAVLITIPGYQGAPRYYKIKTGIMSQNYRSDVNPTLPVITGDWDPEGWGYNWGTATRLFLKSYGLYAQRIDDREVLTEVVLPDGRSLKFRYNEFGEVAEVELPTGAKIQYDHAYRSSLPSGNSPSWQVGTNGAGNEIPTDVKSVDRAVTAKRTYPDGVSLEGAWSFGYSSQLIGSVTYPSTTVSVTSNTSVLLSEQRHIFLQAGRYTEPYSSLSQHDGTHYTLWSTGVEWRTETIDAAGNVLAAAEQDWSQRAPVSWSTYPQEQPAKDNRVNQTRRYLETGMMAKVETFYDQYNNPIEVKEYDYDQTLKRRTVTSYLNNNNGYNYQTNDSIHLLGLPATQTVYDGSGNQVAKTITEYDVYTNDGNRSVLTSYASVSQHDSNYGTAKTTRGNPTRIGTWLNTTGSYIYVYPRYDIVGNVVSIKDARGNVSTVSFADDFGDGSNPGTPNQNPATPTYALPTLITSPPPVPGAPAHTARSQYDYSTGLLTGFRDRNNVITQTIYNDKFNRPTWVKSALGISGIESHVKIFYAPATTPFGITLSKNDVLTAEDQTALGDGNLRSWTVTDGYGRTKEGWTRDPQGNVKVATIYDALGRTKQVSNPFRPSLGETAVYSETTYDLLERVTAVTAPDSSVVSTTYSANSITVTDQTSKKRKSVTDALGRLKEIYEDPNGLNYLTSYQYDTLDNLAGVTQGSQTRTFTYNSLKQLLSATNPESGTISYQYDAAANLLVKTDARGVSAHYAYDAFNRVVRRWYNASSSISATTHNSPALPSGIGASNEANFFYDVQALPSGAPSFTRGASNGRLVAVTYGTNSSAGDYTGYDAAGRNVLKIQRTGSLNYQMSAVLNMAGAPTSLVYPSGRTVNYVYDVAGRTSSMVGNLGDGTSRNYATELNYSVWGGVAKEKFGTSSAVYHKLHYNLRGQLCDVRASNVNDEWGGELGALANYYSANGVQCGSGSDNNGNVLKSQTIINSFYLEDRYTYDGLNRLTSFSEYQNGTTQTSLQEYDYDRWGNRTIKPATWGVGINNKQFTVNPANNRLGVPAGQSGAMSYDAAGNLTNDTYTGTGNRTYDAENKITSAWGGNNQAQLYSYDANGQRIKRTVDGVETWQVYGFDGELLAEYPANGAAANPQKEYGYRNGQLLITAEAAGGGGTGGSNSLSLNGSTAYMEAPQSASLDIVGPITLEAWVKLDATVAGYRTVIAKHAGWAESEAGGGYRLTVTDQGKARFDIFQSYNNYSSVIGVTALSASVWHHLAGVFDGSQLRVYVDGVLDGTASLGVTMTATSRSLLIGRIHNEYGQNQLFAGLIDEARVSNAALYTSNFTLQTSLSASGSTKGLWKFDSQTANDSSGNGNNGTLNGGATYSNDIPGGGGGGGQDVNWTNVVGVSVSGNNLTKTASDDWYNARASSTQAINSGDGYVEFTASETTTNRMLGLGEFGNGYFTYSNIRYAIYLAGSVLYTSEYGSLTNVGSYTSGDKLRVAIESGAVKYYKNGTLLRASTLGVIYPLYVDVALYQNGSTLTGAVINDGSGGGSLAQISWLVTDHLGTPRMILDETGSLANVKRHDYLPFGEELFAPAGGRSPALGYVSGDGVRQQFTQKERDLETGLDYFGARYYSATQGRFTSVDPLMASAVAVDPQSWNRYAYVSNNPLRFVDDDGRIRRDRSGNIIFDPVGRPVVTRHPSGDTATVQRGYIYADNGDRIEAFRNISSDSRFDCDCHGLTFGDGQYWINDNQVDRLLAGDGYDRMNEPEIGDVAVYRENGQVVHSTTVTGVENDQVTVSGLGGLEPASSTTTAQAAWPGATVTYYHKRNDNRSSGERQSHAESVRNHNKAQARIGAEIERQLGPPPPPPPPPPPQPKRGKKGQNED